MANKCKFCKHENDHDVTILKTNGLFSSLEGRKCRLFSQRDEWYCRKCHSSWVENWTGRDDKGNKYKVFSAQEIRQMKPGTCFQHITLGPCILMKEKDSKITMQFKIKEYPATPVEFDVTPWTLPMRVLDNEV